MSCGLQPGDSVISKHRRHLGKPCLPPATEPPMASNAPLEPKSHASLCPRHLLIHSWREESTAGRAHKTWEMELEEKEVRGLWTDDRRRAVEAAEDSYTWRVDAGLWKFAMLLTIITRTYWALTLSHTGFTHSLLTGTSWVRNSYSPFLQSGDWNATSQGHSREPWTHTKGFPL